MRLAKVASGHRLPQRLLLGLMRLVGRREPPDVVKALLYRPEFWGHAQNDFFEAVMRGPSRWTVGERELMAAFVSAHNQCLF